jgi:alpha-tubulin suppressor-like RCC1 family protein
MSVLKQNNTYKYFVLFFLFCLFCLSIFFLTKKNNTIDCSGDWKDWSICDVNTGTKTRMYEMKIPNSKGAETCPGTETIKCNIDCSINWNNWTNCDEITGTKTRTYEIIIPKWNDGIICPELQAPQTIKCDVDCSVDWNNWTECDRGITFRTYKMRIPKLNNGKDCPQPEFILCPVDCSWNWTNWNDCNANTGERSRTINIIKDQLNDGKCPGPQLQTILCPVDCSWNWSNWNDCNTNTGQRSRIINKIIIEKRNNGKTCPQPQTVNCNVDCSWNWTNWNDCNANTGQRSRTNYRIIEKRNNGITCPYLEPQTILCPVDCSWNWYDWNDCNANTGQRSRTMYRIINPLYGGKNCPEPQIVNCSVDCSWNWYDWNDCNVNTGQRTRTNYRIIEQRNGGITCPLPQTVNCDIDCSWNWSNWNICNVITGQRTRTINRTIQKWNEGSNCPVPEIETLLCDVDCSWNWYNWNDCNANTGQRSRTMYRIIEPRNNGIICPLTVSQTVNCPVDCSWNWYDWNDCNVNTGQRSRTMYRIIEPRNNGIICPLTVSQTVNCPVDCSWNWYDWNNCNVNTGQRTRLINRRIIQEKNNGKSCPTSETIKCDVDCSWNWNIWNDCNANTGQTSRTIYRIIQSRNGGIICPQLEPQTINCPVDCSWNWYDWNDCNVNTGQRTRLINRRIIEEKNNGKSCPISETINCNIDCSWNWSNWSDWKDSCAITGKITRTIGRIINPLKNNGKDCPTLQAMDCPLITDISGTGITSGDITTDNSKHKFMIFTSEISSFTVRSGGIMCDILMIGGGGIGGRRSSDFKEGGGGGAGACIVAIGHILPGGVCVVTVGETGTFGETGTVGETGYDSSISVGRTTLYLAKGGGRGGAYTYNGVYDAKRLPDIYKGYDGYPGGCGGGACASNPLGGGGNVVNTNIVNGFPDIGPTIQPTYAVFGNKGGYINQQGNMSLGGGGIGEAAPNDGQKLRSGGAGKNDAIISLKTYNFKSYFANNNRFGDISGYIGSGGSGNGGYGAQILSGLENTGSGGGGGGGNGGSGIVIIRYREIKKIYSVYSCGRNNYGQLGHGHTTLLNTPTLIQHFVDYNISITNISGYAYNTIFLDSTGKVYGCGDNGHGQLGQSNYNDLTVPTLIQYFVNNNIIITNIACCYYDTIFLDSTGQVYSCGLNNYGQLGHGHRTRLITPTLIQYFVDNKIIIRNIACGSEHVLFLDSTGKVYSCGNNGYNANYAGWLQRYDYGQLGQSNYNNLNLPTLIQYFVDYNIIIKNVTCGNRHTIFLDSTGKVYGCGYNGLGQLGQSNYNDLNVPTLIQYFVNNNIIITNIACCYDDTIFLDSTGKVYSCGYNNHGQLGHGNKDEYYVPTLIQYFVDNNIIIRNIACGSEHVLFLDSTDKVYSCGNNRSRQLGLGDTTSYYTTPTIIPFFSPNNYSIDNIYSTGSNTSMFIRYEYQ